jgi:hypothetical protein
VGLRDTGNGFIDIRVNLQVPSNVADRAKIEMAAKTAKKARKSSLGAAGQVMASEQGDLRAERIQVTLSHLSNEDAKRIKADNSLSDLLDGRGWGHNIANGSFLGAAIEEIMAAGPGCKIPSGSTLGGNILERQHEADKAEYARNVGLPGMSKYGATLTTDGSTTQRHSFSTCAYTARESRMNHA